MPMLPLFPLNTVLFPTMPISLHIFEERYKLMVKQCVETGQPFGVVLLRRGSEVLGTGTPPEPHMIGCTAYITQMQPVGMGRLNIVAVGHQRFRIHTLYRDLPYLTGELEMLPELDGSTAEALAYGRRLRPWIERYLAMTSKLENTPFNPRQLPSDPLSLAYVGASLLRVSNLQKQDLLALSSAKEFLTRLHRLYRKETTIFAALMRSEPTPEGTFSLN